MEVVVLVSWVLGQRDREPFRDFAVFFGAYPQGAYFDWVVPAVTLVVGGALAAAAGALLAMRGRARIAGWVLTGATAYGLGILVGSTATSGSCGLRSSFGLGGPIICVVDGLPSSASRYLILAAGLACPLIGYLAGARVARRSV